MPGRNGGSENGGEFDNTATVHLDIVTESVSENGENQEDELTANRDARINCQLTTFMKCFNNIVLTGSWELSFLGKQDQHKYIDS